MYLIKRGLDIPLAGGPTQVISGGPAISRVGLVGDDYIGLRPALQVEIGSRVRLGDPLFEDKKCPGVIYRSPTSGVVSGIHRGEKRRFQSLVIDVDGREELRFPELSSRGLDGLSGDDVRRRLLDSGLWISLRTRPFGRVPSPATEPHAIFVTAIDTQPLAADPAVVLNDRRAQFSLGLSVLTKLTSGEVYVCRRPKALIPGDGIPGVTIAEFAGPHPAGLAGTHIHLIDPVGPGKVVWYLNYQDVAAIGVLFEQGRIDPMRVISLAGPMVAQPRLVIAPLSADLQQLTAGELEPGDARVISGSVLHGRQSEEPCGFLGRYHLQVTALLEGFEREFLGWQRPGFGKFSWTRAFASAWGKPKEFALTTSTEGSERAMVPIGSYERVMPLDILPTQLLRALIVRDTDRAQELGLLELEEEDLALCTFVCPGKYEYGAILRDNLTRVERDG
jgi:Na+-transporting NADH:ubiquinone oxidoreductase subunit A